jgi:hypothetical protein
MVAQASMKLNEQQLASLSSPKAVNEYLENQKDNILNVIKQNLAVGDIYKSENLQVYIYKKIIFLTTFCEYTTTTTTKP